LKQYAPKSRRCVTFPRWKKSSERCCHPEIGTAKVTSIVAEPGCEVRISRLSFVEVQSVFAIKVRSGFIGRTDAGQQRARLVVDVAAGAIEVCALGEVASREGMSVLNPETP
jgi:hypothetical protein